MLRSHRFSTFAVTVTSDIARLFGGQVLERLDVDWSVYDGAALDDILHMVLRTLQSIPLTHVAGRR